MDHVRELIGRVDETSLRRNLFCLAKDPLPFRKLNYTVPGHAKNTLYEADDWIAAQLQSYGYADVFADRQAGRAGIKACRPCRPIGKNTVEREACRARPFAFNPNGANRQTFAPPPPGAPLFPIYNLYAKKMGRTRPGEIIVLVAHKDSQSWINSPGAYDNAVGTAALLEMARILYSYESQRTISFLFCNEEHQPWTSVVAAQNARRRRDNIVAVFNTDAIGGKSDADIAAGRRTNVTRYTTPEGKHLADLMAEVNAAYGIGLIQTSCEGKTPGDDSGSFINAGYNGAVVNIGSFPYADAEYHLEGDVPERVDIVNVRMTAQATLAAVLRLDLAP